ncbi:MAG: cyanophycin synthetase [Acetivibrionales bacterium]
MDLKDIRIYRGPSVYSHKPVVRMEIKLGNLMDVPTKDIEGLNESIIKLFPGLKDHSCSLGYAGGFLERLYEGTYIAHVAEHLCIEMQRMIGYDVKFGRARNVESDIYQVVYGCINPVVGKACGVSVVDILNNFITGRPVDFEERLKRIKVLDTRYSFGPSTLAIVNEAKKRGIPVNEIADSGVVRLGYGKHQKIISATLYEDTSSIAVDIACDKALAKAILDENFIPVPRGAVCRFSEEAVGFANTFGYPLVVKPKSGNQGKFVFTNINSREDLISAFEEVKKLGGEALIEEFITGKDYRLLVVGGKLVAAAERVPAHVIGDGMHSIQELVEIENRNELRGEDHEKPLTKIKIDEAVYRVLKRQKLNMDSIPGKKRIVWLRDNANLSTGGIAIDCTGQVHPENRRIAEIAAKAIGLDIAGIDMVIPDISRPVAEGYGAVVEVNAAPGIRMHLRPSLGTGRNVASSIIDMIYPDEKPFTIPIVSVTGTNGKTTTVRMIGRMLQDYGLKVGMTTTHGIYVNKECIEKGDTTGPKSAGRVLNNREIEVAVLETARGGIIRGGLAYEKADVAVFTNLSSDHLGFDGINSMEELLKVKSLVIEAVKKSGSCILNADDGYVIKTIEKAGGKAVLFSAKDNNPLVEEHIKNGGCAIYVSNGNIYIANEGYRLEIIKINDIPAVLNGALVHNIYNSMAAIGAVYSLGLPPAFIRKSLKSFSSDNTSNPGRFNLYEIDGIKVILDYGHNIEGYRVTVEGAAKLNPARLIGIIGIPGNRRNEDIKEIGKFAARSFDRIIIKEDSDLRGRKPLEVASILKSGVIEGGFPEDKIIIIPDEKEALETALKNGEKGDIITVFFEDMERVEEVVNQYTMMKNALKARKTALVAK